MTTRPNVILIVLDTARRDRFGCYGHNGRTTPTVDALASEGTRFDNMITNGPYTLPSHASLFTGLYPSQHGSQWQTGPRLRSGVQVTMAEWFRDLGYETVCATNNGLISKRTTLDRGFDRYAFRLDLERGVRRVMRRTKKALVGNDSGGKITNKWLERTLPEVKKPLFLFVNFLECHWAYVPPPVSRRQVGGPKFAPLEGLRYRLRMADRVGPWEAIARARRRELDIYSSLYDAELATADRHVDELLGILRRSGQMPEGETIVIVTSDHGEHLGEQGLADHHASLDDYLINVPFVVWGPGIVPAASTDRVFEFVDVLPSLASLLGEEPPAPYLTDRRTSMFEAPSQSTGAAAGARDYAVSEWRCWPEWELGRLSQRNPSYDFTDIARDLICIRDETHKLVRGSDGNDRLFHLTTDPHEELDISESEPEVVRRLGARLDAEMKEWESWDAPPEPLTADDEAAIEKQLTALGYI